MFLLKGSWQGRVSIIVFAVWAVTACSAEYPGLGEERIAGDEDQISQQMVDLMKRISEKRYPNGGVRRFNQAKSLGCFDADFHVDENLPDELRKGMFYRPGPHKALVRFANASETDDREKDLRGMSIKVFGVSGKSLWGQDGIQDFVLNSYPALFAATAGDFLDFIKARENNRLWGYFLNPFDMHLKSLWVLFKARETHSNPFVLRYWSTTPYRFGLENTVAVKYSVKSCSKYSGGHSGRLHENQLRYAMHDSLQKAPACFDFMVQVQEDPRSMPIENAQVIWDEGRSAFRKVATLTIQNQDFTSRQAMEACEKLSFNPWQSLAEHRPLGGINRVRKTVYEQMSQYRNRINEQGRSGLR